MRRMWNQIHEIETALYKSIVMMTENKSIVTATVELELQLLGMSCPS